MENKIKIRSKWAWKYLLFATERPRTINTFLAYRLRGAQKGWESKYRHTIEWAMYRLQQAGLVKLVRSVCGGDAYVPADGVSLSDIKEQAFDL